MKLNCENALIKIISPVLETKPLIQKEGVSVATSTISSIPSKVASNPAYFHPSFCGAKVATEGVKALTEFLDYAIKNPQDIKFIEKNKINFKEILSSLMNQENHLGSGHHSDVYRLDDKYVFKIFKGSHPTSEKITVLDNSRFAEVKDWYGAVLAEGHDVQFLRNANPDKKAMTIGLPCDTSSLTEANKKLYDEVYLPKCAKMPQKAFDNLAFNFKAMNNVKSKKPAYSFYFDERNPNNFLMTNDAFKIMDEVELLRGQDMNNLSSMLNVLVHKYDLQHYTAFDKALIEPRREILKKCLLANEKAKIPIPDIGNSVINESFKNSGLGYQWRLTANKINELRETVPNTEERVKRLEEYLNQLEQSY